MTGSDADPSPAVPNPIEPTASHGGLDPADEQLEPPIVLNCWKHHAPEIRRRVRELVERGNDGLTQLPRHLLRVGGALMDLYLGRLTPTDIAGEVLGTLDDTGRRAPDAFRPWIDENGGYQMVAASDGSQWCLRNSVVPNRHIHVHPGRYSPHTIRVRANLLKTAVATLALAELESRDPLSLDVVNDARQRILNLDPMPQVSDAEGIGVVLRQMLHVEPLG